MKELSRNIYTKSKACLILASVDLALLLVMVITIL